MRDNCETKLPDCVPHHTRVAPLTLTTVGLSCFSGMECQRRMPPPLPPALSAISSSLLNCALSWLTMERGDLPAWGDALGGSDSFRSGDGLARPLAAAGGAVFTGTGN